MVAERRHGVLGSMRVRVVAAVAVLLLVSSVASVLVLRGVLLSRLDRDVRASLSQEIEEFQLLAAGPDPATGAPFMDDPGALFDAYFAGQVPDEGEALLGFIDGDLYREKRAQDAAVGQDISQAVAYWLALDAPRIGTLDTVVGDAHYAAVPMDDALFVVANFPAFERGEIEEAVRTQAVVQIGTLLVACLLAVVVAGRVLRPLRALASTARRITDSDLTQRIPVRGSDEASQIASAFNDMLGRLGAAFAAQRSFLDDAGHELRAPLTVVRGHLELLELDSDADERHATVTLVHEEIDRMNRLVGDLLVLADAPQPDFVISEPLRLDDLTVGIVRRVEALAPRRWHLEEVAQTTVRADGQRLTQAMVQLAHNAVQHTETNGLIRIGSAVSDNEIRLWVHDDGPGVAPEDAERIFERFVHGARPRTGGVGLGLAIVQAIAVAHGGQVHLVQQPPGGRGARFEIVLPYRRSTTGRPVSEQRLSSV